MIDRRILLIKGIISEIKNEPGEHDQVETHTPIIYRGGHAATGNEASVESRTGAVARSRVSRSPEPAKKPAKPVVGKTAKEAVKHITEKLVNSKKYERDASVKQEMWEKLSEEDRDSLLKAIDDVVAHTDLGGQLRDFMIDVDLSRQGSACGYFPAADGGMTGDAAIIIDPLQMLSLKSQYSQKIAYNYQSKSRDSWWREKFPDAWAKLKDTYQKDKAGKPHATEHTMFLFKSTAEAAVRHELGHAFHGLHEKAFVKAFGKSFERKVSMIGESTESSKKYGVTTRGKSDNLECLAENFTLYSIGRTDLMHPDMVKVFKELTTW